MQLLEKLNKALHLTKPKLDYNELRHELLTIREAHILSVMIVLYFKLDRVVEVIKVRRKSNETIS